MAELSYSEQSLSVKHLLATGAIIAPQPGEFVAALLERGHVSDALSVQREQYALGQWRALHNLPTDEHFPAAIQAGFRATILGLLAERVG